MAGVRSLSAKQQSRRRSPKSCTSTILMTSLSYMNYNWMIVEPKKTYFSRYSLEISIKMNSSSKIFVLQIKFGDHEKSRRTTAQFWATKITEPCCISLSRRVASPKPAYTCNFDIERLWIMRFTSWIGCLCMKQSYC